jgi:hypothetical protein
MNTDSRRRPKVVVTNRIHPSVLSQLEAVARVEMNADLEPWTAQNLAGHLHEADAMMGFMTDRVDQALLDQAPRLRVVACALKGFDNYDVEACTRAGVWLSIVPDLLTVPTAELAIGLAIALARNIRAGDALVREGQFKGWRPQLYGTGLADSTVAVVGLGCVGRAIAARLAGFGCARIVGVDPAPGRVGGDGAAAAGRGIGAGALRLRRCAADARFPEAHRLGCTGTGAARAVHHQRGSWLGRGHDVRMAIEQRAAGNIVAVLQGHAPPDAINLPRASARTDARDGRVD